MEKLKDPSMLLSVANSIGIVGITAYFYKQIEAQRLDLIKMSQTLSAITRKLTEMEKGEQNKGEVLHTLNDQIKTINQQLENMPSFDTFNNVDDDLSEIIAVLEENNIPVNRPSQIVRSRRNGDRRHGSRRMDEDDRMGSSSRRSSMRSSDRSYTREEGRASARDDIRASSRRDTSRDNRQRPEPRQEPRPEPNYDDDNDIISQVRQQQTR